MPTISDKLQFGAKQAIENCLRLKKGEKFCMITDKETYHIAEAMLCVARKITDDIKIFVMEDFGDRTKGPLKFPNEIGEYLKTCDASIFAAQDRDGEGVSFRHQMLAIIEGVKKLRHGHMIGINDVLMQTGMCVDYSKVQEIGKKIFDVASKAKKIHVTTKLGTDFIAEYGPDCVWKNGDGKIEAGHWSNLPGGEVYSCPETISGKVVCDGVIGEGFSERYGIVDKMPVYLSIKDGRVTSIECNDKDLEHELREYIKMDTNANRIGELGIGINIGLDKLVGTLLQDEKFPGVHVAVGHPYGGHKDSGRDSLAHCDFVMQKVNIEVDGRVIMKEGKFLI